MTQIVATLNLIVLMIEEISKSQPIKPTIFPCEFLIALYVETVQPQPFWYVTPELVSSPVCMVSKGAELHDFMSSSVPIGE